ncbi:component of SCAR regulatory complex [Heterostelium album PN500]|uniref:Component of SCAR regulatory complex n=1 Tax=Heterostelium pallidum (strain ATCC 26659 / Pp 5 / PN500) TaxID=670386 RepID=D3BEK9_HETP5|nr:component of SCAR regulatory complex [Heterostelium album PN500]EFA80340.1 component of SCAR regulatory complex [Heterostelium album PN500]|eukprot:XP_020432460.1 component of SCAR regulatory complex [Heterostelium album PN500]
MSTQIKIPDKIHVLTENGEQLLHRLYNSRQILQGAKTRPLFLNDEKVGRAIKNLMSKFPDFPELDKIQGVELLTSRAKQYVEDLEQHYETLVDVCDWKEAAFALLQEIAGNTVALRFTSSIQLSSAFIELVVIYGKIHILVSMIADRRVVLGVYARLVQHLRSQIEPNYSRVVKWLNECDLPVKKLQDEFRVLNDSIGHVLMSLEPTYAKRKLITQLRRDGALNLILKPEDIARPVQDQYRIDLTYASRMNQWILYGYLFAPGSLTTPQSIELVKFALSEGFNLPVFKDISFPIHNEFNGLFKNYKSKTIHLQKQKKVIKEAAQASTQEAPRKHNEKRIYIRQELEAMWNLFRDRPCLLAPKINVLIAALSMAKDEIFWYFRHIDAIPPEKVKKFYNKQNDIRERRISSLFYLIDHLVQLVKTHKKIIQSYYIEYIAGADTLGLSKVLNPQLLQNAGTTVAQTINTIMNELKSVSLESFNRGTEYNFNGLRDNWCRLEYLLYSSSCPLREAESSQISSRLNLIYIHSRNVDQIEQQLEEFSSLSGLWSFKEPFVASFDNTLVEGNDQPTHVMNYLKLLSLFPSTVPTHFMPEEKEQIGKECAEIATVFLNKISTRIVNILTTSVATQFQSSEAQLADVNAAFPLLQKRKDWKPPKDFVTPVEPGSESSFRARANLEQLRLNEKNAFQLCNALNEFMDITIYDHQFVPREYLRERLGAALKQFMRQTSTPTIATDPSSIIRPTAFETQLKVFLGVMVLVENYIDIDVGGLIRETLLAEFYAKALGKCGRIDWFPEGEIEYSEVTLHNFTNYFTDFISKKAQTPGIVYSPGKFGFLSRAGLQFRAEEHTDYAEVQSFVNMVGPYGVKLVERELLRYVLQNTQSLKEILTANSALLEQYSGCFYKTNGVEHLKRFKQQDLDNFISRSVGIGNALHLRQMMRQAVQDTNNASIPFIQKSIENAFMEYNRNTFSFPEFLGVDTLALDAGLDVGTADQYLKVFLRKLSATEADIKLWDLLPVMYAVCFNSTFWKDAFYRTAIEGHANNVHVLSITISSLLIGFGSINYSSSASEADIVSLLTRFLEISSVQLLRLYRQLYQKYLPSDPASVIIFLDKFVEECPLLIKDNLEQYLPYTFIRNMFKDIYENKPAESSTEQF